MVAEYGSNVNPFLNGIQIHQLNNPSPLAPLPFLLNIDCGSTHNLLITQDGQTRTQDQYYAAAYTQTGFTYNPCQSIIYAAGPLTYNVPLANGNYTITTYYQYPGTIATGNVVISTTVNNMILIANQDLVNYTITLNTCFVAWLNVSITTNTAQIITVLASSNSGNNSPVLSGSYLQPPGENPGQDWITAISSLEINPLLYYTNQTDMISGYDFRQTNVQNFMIPPLVYDSTFQPHMLGYPEFIDYNAAVAYHNSLMNSLKFIVSPTNYLAYLAGNTPNPQVIYGKERVNNFTRQSLYDLRLLNCQEQAATEDIYTKMVVNFFPGYQTPSCWLPQTILTEFF